MHDPNAAEHTQLTAPSWARSARRVRQTSPCVVRKLKGRGLLRARLPRTAPAMVALPGHLRRCRVGRETADALGGLQ